MMKLSAAVLVALLLVAQGCSARRVPLNLVHDHKEEPEPKPKPTPPQPADVRAGATASAQGTNSAAASAGSSADGATRSTVSGGLAQATGTKAETAVDAYGINPTSSGSVSTRGKATGSVDARSTSIGLVLTQPNSASSAGFSVGGGEGYGSSFAAQTATKSTSPFGTATGLANTLVTSNIGVYGTAASAAESGPGGLLSESRAIALNGEGSYGNTTSTAYVIGGYGISGTASTIANTVVTAISGRGTGDAQVTGLYGIPRVIIVQSSP